MPNPLPMLLLDTAELGADMARGGGPSNNSEVAAALEAKHEALEKRRVQTELQLAEIEKFHMELTGKPNKEAALRALTWTTL